MVIDIKYTFNGDHCVHDGNYDIVYLKLHVICPFTSGIKSEYKRSHHREKVLLFLFSVINMRRMDAN